ncbi:hypothetical protein Bca4012_079148 [Brassica carinata]
MSSLSRELVFLILQFLEEEKFKESVHRLEKESGFFFNTKYFDEKVLAGEWDEVEKYLSGFTKLDDNRYSMKIFFEIRKQKYLEALDKQDKAKAVEILVQDLRVFSTFNEELYKEITQLLTLHNFRENEQLSKYGDTKTARTIMLGELKKLIEANPLFRDKLTFPTLRSSRLRTLINQSLNWQHQLCKNPRPNPDIKTLFTDHTCAVPNGPLAPSPVNQPVTTLTKPTAFPSLGAHGVTYPAPRQHAPALSLEDLPLKAALALHQGSTVTSMDFHPMQNTLLLVGSATGEITLWELAVREKLVSKPFKIWDMANCSPPLQALIAKETPMSVTRVAWSPDGNFIGVAYTKHLIHLYAFSGPNDLRQHAEVSIRFDPYDKQCDLCVVTCGDDQLIKVWDVSGRKHFTFEGHEAPVYSICPHHKENIQFIFSTAIDGKIKAWLYDNMGSRVDYDAPGKWCTTMLYSADGTRLFSCGTSKDGDFSLVEWNESEGSIKRTYLGFQKKLAGMVQFDTSKNHFLAVGEDAQIKFWDMDNINVLTSTDAEGGLPALPRLRFNREGNLLAVTTADNGFKILANQAGFRSLRAMETSAFEKMRTPADSSLIKAVPGAPVASVSCKVELGSPVRPSPMLNGVDPSKPRIDDSTDKPKPWQLAEILDPAQCRQATLPDTTGSSTKVVRLLYTNSGAGILALGFNGIQRLWKWVRNEQNPSGKATAAAVPQHWQPNSGLLMTNDVSGVNLEEANPCIALSKNDSYVMSAAGGKVSLFNMMTFKVMTTFMPPPPPSSFLAFHPQDNNIIAIGMEDSTIHIYNVRVDEVKSKLKGHQKRITGLAFSTTLNILVSSGADAQICFWSIDTWEKRKSVAIQMPAGKVAIGDTRVQFHVDQIRILAVHETQLAIFDASKMECIRQWNPQDSLSSHISSAVYACNSQLIYTTFRDGNIGVFDADTLGLRCRISPSAYLPQGNQGLSPLVVAAHPQEPNQFAVGLNDGSVKVIEPTEAEGKWGMVPPSEAINTSTSTTSNQTPEQLQR